MKWVEFDHIPISGDYSEYDFGSGTARYWVKFADFNYEEWCGKFGLGSRPGKRKILGTDRDNEVFILADGQGYFVDIEKRELLGRTEDDMIEDAVAIPDTQWIAVTEGLTIQLLSKSGVEWKSRRVSVDGIEFIEASAESIKGKFNCLGTAWCDFVFQIAEKRFEADWILEEHWPS